MKHDTHGKTALVTGGTTGIGFATAQLFHRHGARVAITGQDAQRLKAARAALGSDVLTYTAGVHVPSDLARLRTDLEADLGHLDIVFANAGVAFATPLGATEDKVYDALMDINVKGVFFSVQTVLPIIREGGSIILNTSWLAEVGTAELSALSASKAAVRSFCADLVARIARPQDSRKCG